MENSIDFSQLTSFGSRREKPCLRGGCGQYWRRPACTSAQSDQHLCYSLIGIISRLTSSKISYVRLVSVGEQAGLNLIFLIP